MKKLFICLFLLTFSLPLISSAQDNKINLIKGYDGINFGMTINKVGQHLAKLEGSPKLERVPTKPYYRYWIKRKGNPSEVSVWFKGQKVIQLKDVFGGKRLNKTNSAIKVFEEKKKEFIRKWGLPTRQQKDLVVWVKKDGIAVLRLIRPDNPYALPVLKIVVSTTKNTAEIKRIGAF